MATSNFASLTVKGVKAEFHDRMETLPTFFQNHCMVLSTDTDIEPYAFPGFVPQPRVFLDERAIQTVRDFTFNIQNQEYELSIKIKRKSLEDDQTGLIMARVREMAEVWGTYKDYLFTQLLINGGTSGFNGWDGTTYYSDTHTAIGGSGTFDNKLTSAAADVTPYTTVPTTSQEALFGVQQSRGALWRFKDDTGRPFNSVAMSNMRVVIPPTYEAAFAEAKNGTLIPGPGSSSAGSRSNVYQNWFNYDVSPYLTADTKMYVNALGAERKPFVYQERTPLEIEIFNDAHDIARENGLLILCRQRFVITYGEPRRSIEYTYS